MLRPHATIDADVLSRSMSTVLFADVVDSVRLVEADEERTIRRWLAFVDQIETELARSGSGRIVKKIGDGLMMEFDDPSQAVRCAIDMRDRLNAGNASWPEADRFDIRIGLNMGDVLRSSDADLYGREVNIAARLAASARPGEIAASANVRDALASDLVAEFEDIGPVHLKNVADPVHAFSVGAKSDRPRISAILGDEQLLPTIAVLPVQVSFGDKDSLAWRDLVTEDLIVALSRSDQLNVISRLSTAGIVPGSALLRDIGKALSADFILSGSAVVSESAIRLELELASVQSGHVIWSDGITVAPDALLLKNAIFSEVAGRVHQAILNSEVRRALSHPVPTLKAYSLLTAAVGLMHRLSRHDFALAGQLLDELTERFPETPGPLAWKSRWHVLRVAQGWSDDLQMEGRQALALTGRALDLDPTNTSALIAEGFVRTNLLHQLDEAEELYDSALEHSPNEATGRALRGTLHAFRGDGDLAVRDCERALHLAPLDPNRFFFLALAAGACLSARDYARALELAKASIRLNRSHTSTLRIKAVAELNLGMPTQARLTLGKLMKLQPGFTVSAWRRNAPSDAFPVGQAFAAALRDLGVPE